MNFIDIANASPESTAGETAGGHTVVTTTEANETGILASFGINGTLFAFQALNFLLVFLVVWFLILKPLTGKMTERQKMIDDSIDNAKEIEKKLRQGETAFQEKVDMAKAEAGRIIEKAKAEADNLSAEIKEKTKRDIEGLVLGARAGIREEKETMIRDLKVQTAEIVVATVEKFLEEKMTEKKDKELIAKSIKEIDYEEKQ